MRESSDGQGMVEYGLIIMLVALIVIVALAAFGVFTGDLVQEIADSFP